MTFLLFSSINERDTVHCSWAWACTTNCLVTCLILLFFSFTHISFLIDYIKGKQLVSAWRNVPHYIKHIQKWFLPLSFYSFYSTQLYWNKRTSWFWYASSIHKVMLSSLQHSMHVLLKEHWKLKHTNPFSSSQLLSTPIRYIFTLTSCATFPCPPSRLELAYFNWALANAQLKLNHRKA